MPRCRNELISAEVESTLRAALAMHGVVRVKKVVSQFSFVDHVCNFSMDLAD
jgi:hypothetical protein